MITAIDILKNITKEVSNELFMKINFHHGHTLTVVNLITELKKSGKKAYPAVIVFTEGIIEKRDKYYFEFTIPKIAICTLTKLNASDEQRLESTFKDIIYPIFENLQKKLQIINVGYDLSLTRTDIPFFLQLDNKNTFNQLVDGCIIKNLKMKVMYEQCKLSVKF